MRACLSILLLSSLWLATPVMARSQPYQVVVTDPYVDVHSGPGGGYPIFHVVERGEEVEVLKRRTDWF
ncbi:MAG: SH3 domain-containing protein, partial [Gammaproteobacteria bacterium]